MQLPGRKKSGRKTVRVAGIGAGNMATQIHYPLLASYDDVQIVALCDAGPARLHAAADALGVEKRYVNYRLMIEECAPDAVYALGQPHLMYDTWVWCLEHGQNLYVEKPLGTTWHQAQMLAHLADQKRAITQVSHQRRSIPLLAAMRQKCLEKGSITHAVCEFYKCDPTAYPKAVDRMLGDCVHAVDTVRWMCGGEVTGIESRCKRVGTPDINWIEATLQFDNGATGIVLTSWASGRRIFRTQMHVPGACAEVDVEGKARFYAAGDTQGVEYDAREVAGSADSRVALGFHAKNREFIDSVKNGVDVTSSPFRDAVKTMEVAEKILAQALLRGD